eukprot:EG_transcript_25735
MRKYPIAQDIGSLACGRHTHRALSSPALVSLHAPLFCVPFPVPNLETFIFETSNSYSWSPVFLRNFPCCIAMHSFLLVVFIPPEHSLSPLPQMSTVLLLHCILLVTRTEKKGAVPTLAA